MSKPEFETVFAQLRLVMLDEAEGMQAAADLPGKLEMNAPWAHPTKPKMQMWFGAVRTGSAYVSYHLMPVYSHPRLLQGISPELRRHMQGKSCFNFKSLEPALLKELGALTADAARVYAKPFKIPGASPK